MISEQLKKIRADRGWNQYKMSQEMGVSPSTYRSWERYEVKPTVETLHKALCRIGETITLGERNFREEKE